MTNPPTDAASAATLNGSNWLANLLNTGLAGYIAVETVRAQKRQAGSVTTDDIPRVDAPPPESPGILKNTWLIAGGILVTALTLLLFLRRK